MTQVAITPFFLVDKICTSTKDLEKHVSRHLSIHNVVELNTGSQTSSAESKPLRPNTICSSDIHLDNNHDLIILSTSTSPNFLDGLNCANIRNSNFTMGANTETLSTSPSISMGNSKGY